MGERGIGSWLFPVGVMVIWTRVGACVRVCVHESSLYGKEKCVASEETSTAPVINLSLSDS